MDLQKETPAPGGAGSGRDSKNVASHIVDDAQQGRQKRNGTRRQGKAKQATAAALDTPFKYSTIVGHSDTAPQLVESTWMEFIMRMAEPDIRGSITLDEYFTSGGKKGPRAKAWSEQKNGPAIIPATFAPGNRRCDQNVIAIHAAVLDIDNGPTLDDAQAKLEGYRYLIHTSYSHTPETHRYRAFVPLKAPAPPARLPAIFEHFNRLFDGALDPACRNPSCLFYLPSVPPDGEEHYQRFIGEGDLFDPATITASDPAPAEGTAPAVELPADLPEVDLSALGLPARVAKLVKDGKARGERSEALFSVLGALVRGGLDDATIAAVVLNPDHGISSKPHERGRDWLRGEIARARAKFDAPIPDDGDDPITAELRELAAGCSSLPAATPELREMAKGYPDLSFSDLKAEFQRVLREEKNREREEQQRQAREARRKIQEQEFEAQEQSPEELLQELNQKHAVVPIANRVMILTNGVDPALQNRRTFVFSSSADFRLRYANRTIMVPSGEAFKRVPIADWWIQHSKRRQYEGITFYPGETPAGYLNLWTGFAVEARPGECQRLKDHAHEVLCAGDDDKFQYLWMWCAHLVQRPWELPETAVVMRGMQGTGKDTFVKVLGQIFGRHYLPLTQTGQLVGRFSAHMMDTLLVFANEAVWGGDKTGEGSLKAMITDPVLTVEAKGKDAIPWTNYRRIMAASNESWAVPRGIDDRRFFCLDVSPHRKRDAAYFTPLHQEIEAGAAEALLFDLLAVDLDGWHPRGSMPAGFTDGEDMKLESASPVLRFWFQCLEFGRNRPPPVEFHGVTPPDDPWALELPKSELYDYFTDWCDRQRITHRTNVLHFGRELAKACELGEVKPWSNTGKRQRCYRFPPLDDARRQFQEKIARVEFDA